MNDIYETRKHDQGAFVSRPFDDCIMALYPSGSKLMRRALPVSLVQSMLGAALPTDALLSPEPNGAGVRSALGLHETEPFKSACKAVWEAAERILEGPVYVHQSRVNFKRAGTGTGWSWHSDFETWHAQDGMPRPLCVTAMIPLEPNTEDNGPLLVIPGSHMIYWSAPRGEEHSAEENFSDQKDGVPSDDVIRDLKVRCGDEVAVLAEPGDLFFFDSNLMHGSRPNTSNHGRANFYVVFNRVDNALVEPFSASAPRPIQMGYRK